MAQQTQWGTVLLTGASGFIGGRLREALLEQGADVVALIRASSPKPKLGRSAVIDYSDLDSLVKVMEQEKPQYIFHVAGATKGVTYADFQRANVMPTENLLKAIEATNTPLKRFLYMSSLTAYGPSAASAPLTEDAPCQPIEFYGKSKLEAEKILMGSKVPYTIVRPGGVYGPADVDYFELFKSAAKGVNAFFGNEHRWMSVVYVSDLVSASTEAAAHENTVNKGYFICDGKPVTWGEFQGAIVKHAGRKVRRLSLPEFFVDVAAFFGELASGFDGKPRLFNKQKAIMGRQEAWTCTHQAARQDFGYVPKVDQETGVQNAFAWYKENGWI